MSEWETFCDESYYHLWRVRRKSERNFNDGFHVQDGKEAAALVELLNRLERERDEALAELRKWQTLRLWGAEPAITTWTSTDDELPDTDTTVLVHLEDGEVWTGFLDGTTWRFVSGDQIDGEVLHWAHFPAPPEP